MQDQPRYDDVVDDVRAFLEERVGFAVREGVREERIMASIPGSGSARRSTTTSRCCGAWTGCAPLGFRLLVGVSRKGFIHRLAGARRTRTSGSRATIAANVLAYKLQARVFRVHEVSRQHGRPCAVAAATLRHRWRLIATMTICPTRISMPRTRASTTRGEEDSRPR